MNNENDKTIRELLAQFFDAEGAAKAAADIAAGDQFFAANPAPTPSPALLADIKRQMKAANRRHRRIRHWTHRIAAAAVIFVVLGIGTALLQRYGAQSASDSFWQGTMENGIDIQLSQLEQTESDLPVITLEVNGNEMSAMNDMADELYELEKTFWEG